MTSEPPICPDCGKNLKFGGFVLLGREEDDQRTCRSLWKCPNKKHMWWHWADRPDEPLEACPMPHLFRSRRAGAVVGKWWRRGRARSGGPHAG